MTAVTEQEKEPQSPIEEEFEEQVPEPAEDCLEELQLEETEEENPLEALQKANAELTDQLLRKNAEFYNYRNRTTREKEEIGLVAKSKCVSELLPVMDNFERAMEAECGDGEFKKGMGLILKSMVDAFKKLGVEEIEAIGKPFDPDLHYAVSTVENDELDSNTVAAVLQKGYKVGDKVIRHAMVAVANP